MIFHLIELIPFYLYNLNSVSISNCLKSYTTSNCRNRMVQEVRTCVTFCIEKFWGINLRKFLPSLSPKSFTKHSQDKFMSFSIDFVNLNVTRLLIG